MHNLDKLKELAQALPDTVKNNAILLADRMGEVIEGFGDTPLEWRPGIFKIVQATSDRGKLPKGAGIGSFVLGEDLLTQPFSVIPISMNTTRQYWNPDPEMAQMICSSPDAVVGFQYGKCNACPYSKFDTENNKSQCNKTLSILCMAADFSQVFVINFSKTNYMNGIDWKGVMSKAGVAPYKRIYQLSSQTSSKSKNVETIKADPLPQGQNRVEGAQLAFMEELFKISSLDRKESLKKFGEYILLKQERNNGLLPAPDEGADVLLENGSFESPNPTLVEDASEVSTSPVTEIKGKGGKPSYKF